MPYVLSPRDSVFIPKGQKLDHQRTMLSKSLTQVLLCFFLFCFFVFCLFLFLFFFGGGGYFLLHHGGVFTYKGSPPLSNVLFS